MKYNKRVLVTGGAGFLGSHLCESLIGDGYNVVALDNLYTGNIDNIKAFEGNGLFKFIEGDVRELDRMNLGEFDEIYNLACPASPVHYQARPRFTMETSFFGMRNCLMLASKCGAKLLHTSTSEIYGDPQVHPQTEKYWGNVNTIGIRSCYDEGKRVAETLAADWIREEDVDVRMVRIFNTYGPRMHPQDGRVISNFIMQVLKGEDITIFGEGKQTRSFQYCSDLIDAMRRFMALEKDVVRAFMNEKRLGAPVVNTGNPEEYTIRELAEEILQFFPESKSKVAYHPMPSDDPKKRKPDIAFAHELLGGWRPNVPLKEGLAMTIEYFKKKSGILK
jgi:UDP-glucuronate decarboxylase